MNQAHISRISVARLCNRGNYEHIRYEVTVEIPPHSDVAQTVKHVETALEILCTRPPDSDYELRAAMALILSNEEQKEKREYAEQVIFRHNEWEKKRNHARNMLADFGLNTKYEIA